ncbi:DUF397 domain-containing protein [Lentzea fradiae]|uniref:DUF397 domain-containing protein n=1 Tax=Lentzea fradiae TaxID=200378 RepID=UPI000B7E1741|nr:DUF397 domain-containing protein [Lentzea fradiae]
MNEPSAASDIRATPWFKSSYSQPSESACVEIQHAVSRVGVRDSKAPDQGSLTFRADAWTSFTSWVSSTV